MSCCSYSARPQHALNVPNIRIIRRRHLRLPNSPQALALSETQREPVRKLLAAQREKMRILDANMREQRESLHESNRNELAKLLSETQLHQFDEMTSRRREKAGPARRPMPRPDDSSSRGPRAGMRPRAD